MTMSLRRSKLFSVSFNLFNASLFFDLYLVMPEASSKIIRRSSGLALTTRSTFPCCTSEYASAPIPVPINNSWMSLSRTIVLLSIYSLSPERNKRRVMVTSS